MADVAALYVDPVRGPYPQIDGVDIWGQADARNPVGPLDRDARTYDGPHPVVAHPPCGPWGKFRWRYAGGEGSRDCGPRAVEQVRAYGGVLEHPQGSRLWQRCGLPQPGRSDAHGWCIEVAQHDWGHPCDKPTWLYVVGTDTAPPLLHYQNPPTHCMVRRRDNAHNRPELPKRQRHLTPFLMAWWMVATARRCTPVRAQCVQLSLLEVVRAR